MVIHVDIFVMTKTNTQLTDWSSPLLSSLIFNNFPPQPHPTRLAAVRRPLHYRDLCLSSASRIRIASTYDYFVTLLQPQRCSRVSVVCVWVLIILNHHQLSSIIINDDQYPFWNQNHHHKPQSSLILNFLIIALETKAGKVVIVTHGSYSHVNAQKWHYSILIDRHQCSNIIYICGWEFSD